MISDPNGKDEQPWYLITNDLESTREKIIKIYYHRFEIEEFFRDAKRLLGLENLNVKKPLSLEVILWFVILSIWFLWQVRALMTAMDWKLKSAMKLSAVRYCWEMLWRQTLFAAKCDAAVLRPNYQAPMLYGKV